MGGWKSSEDGKTKEQQAITEKRIKQLGEDLPMGNYQASKMTKSTVKMPTIPEIKRTKFKKYEKAKKI